MKQHLHYSLLTDVTVNWEDEQYFVTEGSVSEVCAIIQEPTARSFTIDLLSPSNEGSKRVIIFVNNLYSFADFNLASTQLLFDAAQGPQTVCITVTIVIDNIIEDQEIYDLTLDSSDVDVLIGTLSVAQLVIANAHGMRL